MKISDEHRLSKPFMHHFIIIDNFYENPYDVREYALKQTYKIPEFPVPGLRTEIVNDIFNIKEKLSKIIYPNKIINIETGFHLLCKNTNVSFHKDSKHEKRLAGIIYLNPDANLQDGTGFFKYKDGTMDAIELQTTNFEENTHTLFTFDKTLWTEVSRVGNIFNRLVIFNGIYYHKPLSVFGDNINNGRLIQGFAIDIE